jgi:hypothetical protein
MRADHERQTKTFHRPGARSCERLIERPGLVRGSGLSDSIGQVVLCSRLGPPPSLGVSSLDLGRLRNCERPFLYGDLHVAHAHQPADLVRVGLLHVAGLVPWGVAHGQGAALVGAACRCARRHIMHKVGKLHLVAARNQVMSSINRKSGSAYVRNASDVMATDVPSRHARRRSGAMASD